MSTFFGRPDPSNHPQGGVFRAESEQRLAAALKTRLGERFEFGPTDLARQQARILRPLIGRLRQAAALPGTKGRLVRQLVDSVPPEVWAALDAWRPRMERERAAWTNIAEFVTDCVALASPQTSYTAQTLTMYARKLVTWCVEVQGWPLQVETVWSREAIDMFINTGMGQLSQGTRRNYRAALNRISEVVYPEGHPAPYRPLPERKYAEPYTVAELEGFRRWAEGFTLPAWRQKAITMLVCMAGAGLRPSEVVHVYPEHFTFDGAGILLDVVGGARPRRVPVLREWEEWTEALIGMCPPEVPVWGRGANADNPMSAFTANSVRYGVQAYSPPSSARLRTTWLVTLLAHAVPMKAFLQAAGVRKFEQLPFLLDYLDEVPEPAYRQLIRGGGDPWQHA